MDFQIILARGDNDNTAVSITSFHRMMTRMLAMMLVMMLVVMLVVLLVVILVVMLGDADKEDDAGQAADPGPGRRSSFVRNEPEATYATYLPPPHHR